ncbi:MAG: hypothetical protein ACREML_13055 [Vulcanimicrobiaceae bacterium]
MSTRFGDHVKDESAGSGLMPEGIYEACIESVRLMEKDGVPMQDQYGKEKALVRFSTDEGSVWRRYTISFGTNPKNGTVAAFAAFIESATGVKAGDSKQRHVTDSDLVGKRVRVVVIHKDGYANVDKVLKTAISASVDRLADSSPFGDAPF